MYVMIRNAAQAAENTNRVYVNYMNICTHTNTHTNINTIRERREREREGGGGGGGGSGSVSGSGRERQRETERERERDHTQQCSSAGQLSVMKRCRSSMERTPYLGFRV
jgi:hypothetical protein